MSNSLAKTLIYHRICGQSKNYKNNKKYAPMKKKKKEKDCYDF
jgi:hypothetical protein